MSSNEKIKRPVFYNGEFHEMEYITKEEYQAELAAEMAGECHHCGIWIGRNGETLCDTCKVIKAK